MQRWNAPPNVLTSLKDVSKTWKPAVAAHGEPLVALAGAWPQIVGADIAQHSRPLEITGKTLTILTRSSAWSQQLSFLSETVLHAVEQYCGRGHVERIRFRVGRVHAVATPRGANRVVNKARIARTQPAASAQAESLADAFERFRTGVMQVQAQRSAGNWKACKSCGIPIPRRGAVRCTPCDNEGEDVRARKVSRLLFEAPWMGYDGIARVVGDLPHSDYDRIRRRLLRTWWQTLLLALKTKRLSSSRRERLVASSFVILKSGLDPERITPQIVRQILGDELHDLLYEAANTKP